MSNEQRFIAIYNIYKLYSNVEKVNNLLMIVTSANMQVF